MEVKETESQKSGHPNRRLCYWTVDQGRFDLRIKKSDSESCFSFYNFHELLACV